MKKFYNYASKLNLLYVEDDADARESFKKMMEDIFGKIVLAKDGEDAIKKLGKHNVDLIITDVQMPNMDGLEMIQEMKNLNIQIPVIILSAYIKSEYFLKSIKLNVKGYVTKPLDIDALFDVLKDVFLNLELQDEIEKKNQIIKQDHKFLQSIIDNSYESIMVIKEDYSVALMNKATKQSINAQYISDMDNPKCYEVSHHRSTPCDGTEHSCPLQEVIQSKESKTVVHLHKDIDENMRHLEIAAAPMFDAGNNCIGIIETSRDITKHIMVQQQLHKQKDLLDYKANHDVLTGLANRALFEDRLTQAIVRAKRNNTKVALFFIDLDKFKQINDSFGHRIGDYVLQTLSNRMRMEVREEDLLARIGGDEFTLIFENINEVKDIETVSKKLLDAIEKEIEYENIKINISASIGISLYPDDSKDIETLLNHADTAMYISKQNGDSIINYM